MMSRAMRNRAMRAMLMLATLLPTGFAAAHTDASTRADCAAAQHILPGGCLWPAGMPDKPFFSAISGPQVRCPDSALRVPAEGGAAAVAQRCEQAARYAAELKRGPQMPAVQMEPVEEDKAAPPQRAPGVPLR